MYPVRPTSETIFTGVQNPFEGLPHRNSMDSTSSRTSTDTQDYPIEVWRPHA